MFIHTQTSRSIRLRVEINNEYALSQLGKVGGNVDGGGGFAHSTFLVDESVNASHLICDLFSEFQ
jgi:hypothetical protein